MSLLLPPLSALSHAAPNLPLAACWPLHLRTAGKPDAQGTTPAVREAFFHFQLRDSSFSLSGVHFIPPRALLIRPLLPPYGDRFPRVMACCAAAPNTRNAATACPALSPARLSMRHAAAVRCELLAGATSKHHLQLADQSALRILISSTPHQANPKAALSFSACAWGKRKVAHGPVVSPMTMRNLSFPPCTISM